MATKKPKPESVLRAKQFLVKAIQKNDTKTLERILKAGYPIEEPMEEFGRKTPLMFAVSVGEPEIVEMLLNYKADIGARDICDRTPMHYCCRGGNIQNLRLLLSKLTDQTLLESRTKGGVTPLMSAIQSGNVYMVGACLNASFNPFAKDFTGKSVVEYAEPFRDVNG